MKKKLSFKYSKPSLITSTLADVYIKENKSCYFILVIAVSTAVILLFGIFSFIYGRIRADAVRYMREAGGYASNYLDEGTKENQKDIESLSYVENVGCQNRLGYLMSGDKEAAICSVLDKTAYEKIIKPAYTDRKGSYPQKENEIMLSERTLDVLGIKNPEIGMDISVDIQPFGMNRNVQGVQNFILSGYYKEYTDEADGRSAAYMSQSYLEKFNISFYPLRLLIDTKRDYLSGEKIEKMLNQDVILKNPKQLFISIDSPEYQSVETAMGGYGIAVCLGIVVLFSIFALIYNVLLVSMGQRIAQLSLLKIIGGTSKQIGNIIYRQSIWVGTVGCFIGGLLGSFIVCLVLPSYLDKMYLNGNKNFEKISVFNIGFLIGAILFAVLTLFLASTLLVKKMQKMEPLKTLRISADEYDIEVKHSNRFCSKDISPARLAWRNAIRSPRQFAASLLLLTIACETALCAVMLVQGADRGNQLALNPDFMIAVTQDAIGKYPVLHDTVLEKVTEETIYDQTVFTDLMIDEIAETAQIDTAKIEQMKGYLVRISDVDRSIFYTKTKEEQLEERRRGAFYPIAHSDYSIWDGTFAGYHGIGIIRCLTEKETQELETYIRGKQLDVELDTFLKGMGSYIVHNHVLTKKDEQSAEKTIDKPLYLYPALAMYEQDNTFVEKGRLSNCGYLDGMRKGFPKLNMPWQGENILYYLVTQKTFQQLHSFPEQTFQISFRVELNKEEKIKVHLKKWVAEQNASYYRNSVNGNDTKLFTIVCNSDLIAKEKNYINAVSTIMGLICAGLISIGIMNFMNTIITSLLTRRKEFLLLKCIGMTGRQQKKVLVLEFIYYAEFILGLLLIPGTAILYGFGQLMKQQIDYFHYQYPFSSLVLIALILITFSLCIPHAIFRKVSV